MPIPTQSEENSINLLGDEQNHQPQSYPRCVKRLVIIQSGLVIALIFGIFAMIVVTWNDQQAYQANNCSVVVNHCNEDSCEFGGTCFNEVDGYKCTCKPGYYGDRCQYETCQFYITETASKIAPGYISKVDEFGNVIRLSSGAVSEAGIVSDGTLLFYANSSGFLWRLSTDNPSGTSELLSNMCPETGSCQNCGLTISRMDQRLFMSYNVPQEHPPICNIAMLDYGGNSLSSILMTVTGPVVFGLAAEEVNRILYATDFNNDVIYSIPYKNSAFVGTFSTFLSGPSVGHHPTGIVFDDQVKKLFWIIYDSAEIRSMPIQSSSPDIVVASNVTGVKSYGVSTCRKNLKFYYTSESLGGVWVATAGNMTRVKITKINTLNTIGISVP